MIADDDLYWYRASFVKNHDGDTVTVMIDLGFNTHLGSDIRMYGINTPELQGTTMEKAKASRDFLAKLLAPASAAKALRLKSYKDRDDKYGGRRLGELWAPVSYSQMSNPGTAADFQTAFFDAKGEWTNLNQLMVKAELAKVYFGAGEKS